MKTPICDFVKAYAESNKLRLHMPGHKGVRFLGIEDTDITEIDGADVLYSADGIIKQSEENAAALFGTAKTVYSAEGASLAIRAMLYMAVLYAKAQGRRPLVAAGRNAHKTFMSAAALVDFDIAWLYSENSENIISCVITAEALEKSLVQMSEKPIAVYITSPDYLGNISDIKALSDVCHKHDVLLLVDNAHGAYLKFLPDSRHPISLGADICCDSAHKTLPVLTGGAYLHISHIAPEMFLKQAEFAMSLFASTSPSYLILQSLDRVNRYISDGYAESLAELEKVILRLKNKLSDLGYSLHGDEPLKLTIAPKIFGYTGYELSEILCDNGIVCEFADPDFVVMMFTPEILSSELKHLDSVLSRIQRRDPIKQLSPTVKNPERVMSVREAILSPSKEIDVCKAEGKILASAAINCPPAVPIVVCGEKIDEGALKCFEYYGIASCRVVD